MLYTRFLLSWWNLFDGWGYSLMFLFFPFVSLYENRVTASQPLHEDQLSIKMIYQGAHKVKT